MHGLCRLTAIWAGPLLAEATAGLVMIPLMPIMVFLPVSEAMCVLRGDDGLRLALRDAYADGVAAGAQHLDLGLTIQRIGDLPPTLVCCDCEPRFI